MYRYCPMFHFSQLNIAGGRGNAHLTCECTVSLLQILSLASSYIALCRLQFKLTLLGNAVLKIISLSKKMDKLTFEQFCACSSQSSPSSDF